MKNKNKNKEGILLVYCKKTLASLLSGLMIFSLSSATLASLQANVFAASNYPEVIGKQVDESYLPSDTAYVGKSCFNKKVEEINSKITTINTGSTLVDFNNPSTGLLTMLSEARDCLNVIYTDSSLDCSTISESVSGVFEDGEYDGYSCFPSGAKQEFLEPYFGTLNNLEEQVGVLENFVNSLMIADAAERENAAIQQQTEILLGLGWETDPTFPVVTPPSGGSCPLSYCADNISGVPPAGYVILESEGLDCMVCAEDACQAWEDFRGSTCQITKVVNEVLCDEGFKYYISYNGDMHNQCIENAEALVSNGGCHPDYNSVDITISPEDSSLMDRDENICLDTSILNDDLNGLAFNLAFWNGWNKSEFIYDNVKYFDEVNSLKDYDKSKSTDLTGVLLSLELSELELDEWLSLSTEDLVTLLSGISEENLNLIEGYSATLLNKLAELESAQTGSVNTLLSVGLNEVQISEWLSLNIEDLLILINGVSVENLSKIKDYTSDVLVSISELESAEIGSGDDLLDLNLNISQITEVLKNGNDDKILAYLDLIVDEKLAGIAIADLVFDNGVLVLNDRIQASDWSSVSWSGVNGSGAAIDGTEVKIGGDVFTYILDESVSPALDFWTNDPSGDGQLSASEIFTAGSRSNLPVVTHQLNVLTKELGVEDRYTTDGVTSSIDGSFKQWFYSENGLTTNNLLDANPRSSVGDVYDSLDIASLYNGEVYLKESDINGNPCYRNLSIDNGSGDGLGSYVLKSGAIVPSAFVEDGIVNLASVKTCSDAVFDGDYLVLDNRSQALDWTNHPSSVGVKVGGVKYDHIVMGLQNFWTNDPSGDGQLSASEIFTAGSRSNLPVVTHQLNVLTKELGVEDRYTTDGVTSSIDGSFKQWFYSTQGTIVNNLLDAWQTSDPYGDDTAKSIGYAMVKDNTVYPVGYENIVISYDGSEWRSLSGENFPHGDDRVDRLISGSSKYGVKDCEGGGGNLNISGDTWYCENASILSGWSEADRYFNSAWRGAGASTSYSTLNSVKKRENHQRTKKELVSCDTSARNASSDTTPKPSPICTGSFSHWVMPPSTHRYTDNSCPGGYRYEGTAVWTEKCFDGYTRYRTTSNYSITNYRMK